MKKPTKKQWMAAQPKPPVIPQNIPELTAWRLFDPKRDTAKFVPPRSGK